MIQIFDCISAYIIVYYTKSIKNYVFETLDSFSHIFIEILVTMSIDNLSIFGFFCGLYYKMVKCH